jgi:aspartokinase/homoserine dehydrogenase 1
MKILKFGGSSVSTAKCIENVVRIVKEKFDEQPKLAVVVSAFGGATDELIAIGHQAVKNDYWNGLEHLKHRHYTAVKDLFDDKSVAAVEKIVEALFEELEAILQGIALVKELSKRSLDLIMSFGERLSGVIVCHALRKFIPSVVFLDARSVVKTDKSYGCAKVDLKATYSCIQQWFDKNAWVPVITGFIGSAEEETTTLGRGGSDYTAALFGAALKASDIEIWTDVDGVMTADPRKVEQAVPLSQITYKEALEMSHFGAKVIHPPTIAPALQEGIPLWIKNTFNPSAQGTLISLNHVNNQQAICGLSSIDSVALLRVEGSGMVGVCGMAMRLFGALAKHEINIILISQGSSEHSICLAVTPQQAETAKESIEMELALERRAGLIDPVVVEKEMSIVAVVGENMRHTPGIAGRLFGALGKNGVNVVAIAQGSSEYNISIVVKKMDEKKALNVVHEEFFLSSYTTLHVFLAGTGLIGSTLLQQMAANQAYLLKEHAIKLKVVGILNRRYMAFAAEGLPLADWDAYLTSQQSGNIKTFIKQMKSLNLQNSVFVDCTASEEVAVEYADIFDAAISIVTPNKKANSGPYAAYQQLKELGKRKGARFLYETNVGAGLPIISTIKDLLRSGDKIVKIEAIVSGTLSYLFNTLQQGIRFSQCLKMALEKGYTEPDPREDLQGVDVARKLLILARESGLPLELTDIYLEPLLPQEMFSVSSLEHFFRNLENKDTFWEEKQCMAAAKGKVLRYVALLEDGRASIFLKEVGPEHPFYYLTGSDNIVSISTERYHQAPLVIKGQGAGAEVTAGEVLADIIRIAAD